LGAATPNADTPLMHTELAAMFAALAGPIGRSLPACEAAGGNGFAASGV